MQLVVVEKKAGSGQSSTRPEKEDGEQGQDEGREGHLELSEN